MKKKPKRFSQHPARGRGCHGAANWAQWGLVLPTELNPHLVTRQIPTLSGYVRVSRWRGQVLPLRSLSGHRGFACVCLTWLRWSMMGDSASCFRVLPLGRPSCHFPDPCAFAQASPPPLASLSTFPALTCKTDQDDNWLIRMSWISAQRSKF